MLSRKAMMGAPAAVPQYIEEVFSTWLYAGSSATQTITNGIDLAGKGGMVWIKSRSGTPEPGYEGHYLFDTERTNQNSLSTDTAQAQIGGWGAQYFRFLSNGFDTGVGSSAAQVYLNKSGVNYASWTFRKAPKFFDVVTYTGTGAVRTVAHNLGSVPGMMIVKRTDTGGTGWMVYHRSLGATKFLVLNETSAEGALSSVWNNTTPTASNFTLGSFPASNANGGTYVAYLFAHDAGGFGEAGNQNVVSCGSFSTGAGGVIDINIGFEPQWVLIKTTGIAASWFIWDTMRGMPVSGSMANLYANLSAAEELTTSASPNILYPTATGLSGNIANYFGTNVNLIYLAIRRGPMKKPTVGTSVLSVKTYAATTTSASVTHDIVFDLEFNKNRVTADPYLWVDRLRGLNGKSLQSNNTTTESSFPTYWSPRNQTEMFAPSAFDGWWASSSGTQSHSSIALVRAPGFFDVVCYTGTGVASTVNHNLGVAPELIIVKSRNTEVAWYAFFDFTETNFKRIVFSGTVNSTTYLYTAGAGIGAKPTSSVFSVNGNSSNTSATTYVTYLFATVPNVSKVGSYTGTGGTQTINAGLPTGARFVLIKRTDSTGNWWVWDTTRGMVAGTDPRLALNTTDAEVNNNWVYTIANGFQIVTTDATINASGGSYIYLAIA